jgi:hypothetical protein
VTSQFAAQGTKILELIGRLKGATLAEIMKGDVLNLAESSVSTITPVS